MGHHVAHYAIAIVGFLAFIGFRLHTDEDKIMPTLGVGNFNFFGETRR